jgi:hypothetical protein
MMSAEPVTGGCQCGAVRYRAERLADNAHICHCRMCQKAVGNFFAALVGAPKAAVTWTRGRPAVFRSSQHVERGFCSACGTPLFYNDVNGERITLTIGSLDHPERLKPRSQDGIEGRMPWFSELRAVPDLGETEAGDSAEWAAAIKASNRQHPDYDTDQWPPEDRK